MAFETSSFTGASFTEVIKKACSAVRVSSVAELDVVQAKTVRRYWVFGKKFFSIVVRTTPQNSEQLLSTPIEFIKEFVLESFRLARLDLEVAIKQFDHKFVLYLSGKDLDLVTDRNNPLQEALEHLVQRAVSRKLRKTGNESLIDISVVCQPQGKFQK